MASIKDETIIKILTDMGLYVESMLPEVEQEIEPKVLEVELIEVIEPEIEIISVSKSSALKDRAKRSEVIEVG
jgi:hypothetical protein